MFALGPFNCIAIVAKTDATELKLFTHMTIVVTRTATPVSTFRRTLKCFALSMKNQTAAFLEDLAVKINSITGESRAYMHSSWYCVSRSVAVKHDNATCMRECIYIDYLCNIELELNIYIVLQCAWHLDVVFITNVESTFAERRMRHKLLFKAVVRQNTR